VARLLVEGKLKTYWEHEDSHRQQLRQSCKRRLSLLDPLMCFAEQMAMMKFIISSGADGEQYLQSIVDCLAHFRKDSEFMFGLFWPLAFENPNLTHSSILIKPDLTGVACILDWRNLSYVPLGLGLSRVRALLGAMVVDEEDEDGKGRWRDFSENTEELLRHALFELQAAFPCLTVAATIETRRKLLCVLELGHLLDYADAVQKDGTIDTDAKGSFQKMQALVADCRLSTWESGHGYYLDETISAAYLKRPREETPDHAGCAVVPKRVIRDAPSLCGYWYGDLRSACSGLASLRNCRIKVQLFGSLVG
jgi:hypothetical protein